MKYQIVLLVIAMALILSACASPTPTAPTPVPAKIQIGDLWVRPSSGSSGTNMGGSGGMNMAGPTSAAYMVIRNTTSAADRLVKAQTDAAKTVEIHTTVKEGDVMKMQPVAGVDIPANGQAKLEPGGFHVMLIGVMRDLKPGDKIKLTLTFEKAGEVQLDAPVREP